MKKTISINLGGTLFYAEDDAYTRLDSYLREVERFFSAKGDDSAEILRDIETSLAEHFNAAGAGDLKRAVILPEVEEALKNMGTINDFSGEEKAEPRAKESEGPRRFYRDGEHAVIGGVCAGLGHYFGVDPVWIRVLFALSLFLWGFGVIIYFVLWIAAPEAKTTAEKLSMQGEAVNLSSLSAKLKENINSEKLKDSGNAAVDSLGRFFNRLFNLIGRILSGFGPLIRVIFGLFLGLVGILTFSAISVAGVVAAFSGAQYLEPGLVSAIGWSFSWLILSATLVLALPFLAIVFLAISVLRRKNWVSVAVWLGLLLIWFAGLMGASALGSDAFARVKPYYEQTQMETISLQGQVKSVTLEAPFYFSVIPSEQVALQVEGHPADIARVEAVIDDKGELKITAKPVGDRICLNCGRRLNIVVGIPTSTEMIRVGQGGVLDMEGWKSESLALSFAGHSGGNLNMWVSTLRLNAIDFADVDFVNGEIRQFIAQIEGWSRVDTGSAKIADAAITLGDSAKTSVRIDDRLKASFLPESPAARLYYNPDLKRLEADTSTRLQLRFLGQEDDLEEASLEERIQQRIEDKIEADIERSIERNRLER